MRVELPNGVILEDVPDNATKDQIMQKALSSGIAKPEDFGLTPDQSVRFAEVQKGDNSPGFFQRVSDMVTGNDRATAETENGGFTLPDVFSAKGAKVAAGLLSTFDEDAQARIIAENYPGVVFDKDHKGNLIVDARAIGGGRGALNPPGLDARDGTRLAYQMALFTPAGGAGAAASTIPRAMVRVGGATALTQAVNEGVTEFAGGDRSGKDIMKDIAIAGVAGGIFEGVVQKVGNAWPSIKQAIFGNRIDDNTRKLFIEQAQKVGLNADDVTDDFIKEFARRADDATGEQFQTALEREFKVGLTRAQRSGNEAALSSEDAIRSGARGEKPQEIFLRNEAIQSDQINAARDMIQEKVAKGATLLSGRAEAGNALREGIIKADSAANAAVENAYNAVGSAGLHRDGLKEVLKRTRNSIRGVEFDPTLPETAKMLTGIKKFEKMLGAMGDKIKPIHIKRIDQYRRRLNNAIESAAQNKADKRQLVIMKQQFDESLDDAVIKGLFEGDQTALDALKQARDISHTYMTKFGRNGKAPQDKFIQKIINENPTDEEVINSLFSVSQFNKANAANFAKKYKSILGGDSEEWNMVRQAALKNLIKTNKFKGEDVISGQQTLQAIDKALDSNSSLMKELFTPDELAQIKRFGALVKRTQPDFVKSRENASGTTQKAIKAIADAVPIIGSGGMEIFSIGSKLVLREGSKKAAKDAFRPFAKIVKRPPLVNAAGDAITVGAVERAQ